MKYRIIRNALILALSMMTGSVFSQGFEGTVKWAVSTRFIDPVKQAQYEAALKKQTETAEREAMEQEMKEKMPKPAEEESNNPQPGEAGPLKKNSPPERQRNGPKAPTIPTTMVISIKDQNVLTTINGGPRTNDNLYLKEKDAVFILSKENKTYFRIPEKEKTQKAAVETEWENTGETVKILDYLCTRYTKTVTERGKVVTQEVWITTDITKPDIINAISKQRIGRIKWNLQKLQGVPLKLSATDDEMTFSLQVTEIAKKKLDSKMFRIPDGYRENK